MGVECTICIFPIAGQRLCVDQLHFNADKKLFKFLNKARPFAKCDGSYLKYLTESGWKEFDTDLTIYRSEEIVAVLMDWFNDGGGDTHQNEAIYRYLGALQRGTPVVMRWH